MGSTSGDPASSSHLRSGQERGPGAGATESWGFFKFFFPCIAEGVCLGRVYLGGRGSLQAA